MDAVEFIKKQDIMCKQFNLCVDCPMYEENNGHNIPCGELMNKYPEEFVHIVEKWSKEHPGKTRQSEFLKMFPNAQTLRNGTPIICPKVVDSKYNCNGSCDNCRKEYWLAEIG